MDLRDDETLLTVNHDIRLIQRKNGLTFGTDAYLLSCFIRTSPLSSAVEIGCGTGVISLLLAARGKLRHITAVEVQPEFCSVADRNVSLNLLQDKISVVQKDIREYQGSADVVFTNPPYMKCNSGKANAFDEKNIARHEVFGSIDDFCRSAASLLKYGGLFYMVYRPDRLPEAIYAMKKYELEPKRMTMVYPSVGHQPCLVLAEAKYKASPSVFVSKPLILKSNGEDTDDIKYIYERGDFDERFMRP